MNQHDVLILNYSKQLGNKEIEAIQRKGFSISLIGELGYAAEIIQRHHKPILLINCDDSPDITQFLEEICNNATLQTLPLLFITKKIDGLENKLNRHFPLALVLSHPSESTKIIDALRFIGRNYPVAASIENSSEPVHSVEESLEKNLEQVNAEILAANQFFSAIKECNLANSDLGGRELPLLLSGRNKNEVSPPSLPIRQDFNHACTEFLAGLQVPTRQMLERINVITMKIIAPLNLEPEIVELTKIASILFTQAFAASDRSLINREYLFRGGVAFRKEICSAIKDSALNIGGDLANRDLSRIIANVGKLIGQETSAGEDQHSVAASAIVAADLINRNCYQAFFWNLSSAYNLLRKFRQGRIKGLHPAVVCILLKLLAEALSCPKNKKIMASNVATEGEDERLKYCIQSKDETLVDIPKLTAGMRLSRPLETEDGRAVLDEDLVLDDDLILRIWQLSSIRLLNKAVVKRVHADSIVN